MLVGEGADEEPSGAFVSRRDEAVDPPVFFGDGTVGVSLARGASAHRDDTLGMLHRHGTVPPW
jgi:hypothetical protein